MLLTISNFLDLDNQNTFEGSYSFPEVNESNSKT